MKYVKFCNKLCHKDYDVSFDHGAHNGFHLFMEMTYQSGCDVKFIWLTAIDFWLQYLANKYEYSKFPSFTGYGVQGNKLTNRHELLDIVMVSVFTIWVKGFRTSELSNAVPSEYTPARWNYCYSNVLISVWCGRMLNRLI